MYNRELKIKFIRETYTTISTSKQCETIFNACEPSEEKFGGDLCTMPEDVLSNMMDEISGLRHNNWYSRMIVVRQYVKWCIANRVNGVTKSAFLIQEPGISKVKENMVSGPIHLHKVMNVIFYPESEETIDCIYRAFYWLAFSGVKEKDIYKITSNSVDFRNMEIHVNGRDYTIYKESIKSLRDSSDLQSFCHINKTHKHPIRLDRIPGNELLRGTRSVLGWTTVRNVLSKKSLSCFKDGSADVKLSYHRVWLSGVFFRVYENERAGYGVDFSSVVEDYMDGREYKLDSGNNTIESKKRQLARDFKCDYDRWKLAYQIF